MEAEDIRDIFRGLGPVQIRRMFGGKGVYQGEVMFALEAFGELYLKADAETAPLFQERGSRPFRFERSDGRVTETSYWLVPESALDDPDEAAELARLALEAAFRAKRAGARKAEGGPPSTKRAKRLSPAP